MCACTCMHECVCVCVHVLTRIQQMNDCITSLRWEFGMKESIEEEVILRHLRWLGHIGHMADSRMPKCIPFGRLPKNDLL